MSKRKRKDTIEEKVQKQVERNVRHEANRNPIASGSSVCNSCGRTGHSSSRSPICPNHRQTIAERAKLVLGTNTESFIRRVPLNSVVRGQYHELLHRKICELSSFIREIVVRAQIFGNWYILLHESEPIPTYVYSQQFWYSVCQLVGNRSITNTNTNMPADIFQHWETFCSRYPAAIYDMRNFVGYSDALSSACKTLETTYSNHIVENFETYVAKYCKYVLQRHNTVSNYLQRICEVDLTGVLFLEFVC